MDQRSKGEIRKYFTLRENKNMPKWQNAAKGVIKGKFRALNSYVGKEEKSQINYLIFHIKNLI